MSAKIVFMRRVSLAGAVMALGLAAPHPGWSYFQDLGMGARPVAMGEAFTAVADDSNALIWNPAGLADVKKKELNMMYSDLYSNFGGRLYTGEKDTLGFHNVAVALPFDDRVGGFGFAWTLFNSTFYKENSFIFGYGREIGHDVFEWVKADSSIRKIRLNLGINLKALNWRVTGNEYTDTNTVFQEEGLSRTGFTADVGLLSEVMDNVRFGCSLANVIPADVGLTTVETVPMNFRVGTSYRHHFKGEAGAFDSILGALDYTYRNKISDVRVGIESWFLEQILAVRLGSTLDQFTTGVGVNAQLPNVPVDLSIDYTFAYPYGIQATWGSHRISLIVHWGPAFQKAKAGLEAGLEEDDALDAEELNAETNLASQREQELAAQRAQDEARLQAIMEKMRAEIQALEAELQRIREQIKLAEIPSIQFESGKALLKRDSFKTLDQIGEILSKYPDVKVRIEGHTDDQGKAKYNQKLSQQRVEAVKEYMLGKYALDSHNMLPVGYGEARPIASNQTAEGRAINRRVEIKVLMPAGLDAYSAPAGAASASPTGTQEKVRPEDIVSYEEIEKLREKLKVYEMQMNSDDVEEMFEEQHKENRESTP